MITATSTKTTTSSRGRALGAGWRAAAACGRVDPELFYPLDLDPVGPAVLAARRVCAHCPVLPECLGDVLASEDPARRWGVIGGTTPDERTARYARQRAAGLDATGAAA
jgi:WhiB family redox-sensing transcriptional regulator